MSRLRTWLFQVNAYRIAVVVGVVTTILHSVYAAPTGRIDQIPVLSRLETIFHDLKFHERQALGLSPKPTGDVVIGAVDEKAIDTIGRWPWPRSDVARLVDRLTELGAKAIVFDVAYTDAAFEGKNASARKLRSRFEDISLAQPPGDDLLAKLSLARTDAAGAVEAAKGLKETSVAARDVRTRLEPVSQALGDTLLFLQRYRTLNAEFAAQLAQETQDKSADELLAESVKKSRRVVLGSFLITPGEMRMIAPEEAARSRAEVKDVGFDPPVPTPVRDADDVVLPSRPEDSDDGVKFRSFPAAKAPLAALLESPAPGEPRTSLGFFNTVPDDDGVIRREPLVMAVGDPRDPKSLLLVPNIDLAGVLKFYDAATLETRLWTVDAHKLATVAVRPGSALKVDGPPQLKDLKVMPVDQRGQLLLNYYGKDDLFPTVSLADVWSGSVARSRIEGKLVVIGATATGTFDQRVTPFDSLSPGVITHATAMENILHDNYLQRPLWALVLESAILMAISLLVGRLFLKVSVVAGLPLMLATAGAYHLLDLGLFCSGIAMVSFLPLGEVALIYTAQTIYRYSTEEREKRQIRRAFQFYLNKSVIEEMLKDPSKLKLGGDKRVLSVMFSDIRGFTTISEKLSPEQLAKLINEYLTPMTNLVFEHGGTLDKYIGDAVMAIFGAPLPQEDHALRCCRTAVAMMRELAALQARWRVEGLDYPPIDIGIGINSGPMVVGNMGADQRFDYTVLGDNVNLASRLEGTNKDYRSHIIISESTWQMCKEQIAVRELGAVRVKGKRDPVKIYELMDDKPAADPELLEVIRRFNAGIDGFRTQRWADARAKFHSVLELRPDDGPAQAYLDFVAEYEADPPGEGWDGVYTMTHK